MVEAKTNRTCSVHERACGQQAVQGDEGKNEGMVGLLEAAQRFDPHPGTRFATYAVRPLKRSMIKAVVEQRGMVSLPHHKSSPLFGVLQASGDLVHKQGSPISVREVVDELGINED